MENPQQQQRARRPSRQKNHSAQNAGLLNRKKALPIITHGNPILAKIEKEKVDEKLRKGIQHSKSNIDTKAPEINPTL